MRSQQIRKRCDRPHRRACRRRTSLLLQGHRRREPVDFIHRRYTHLMKQSPRIRRNRLQIPPLRLRIQRPKSQRGFPRPRHPRENDHGIPGNIHIDILKIVLASAPNPDKTAHLGDICNPSTVNSVWVAGAFKCRTFARLVNPVETPESILQPNRGTQRVHRLRIR